MSDHSTRKPRKRLISLAVATAVIIVSFIVYHYAISPLTGSVDDEKLSDEIRKSDNLARDIKRMWRTVDKTEGQFAVSPVSAINAASRVFATVELVGKTPDEVFALIGHNRNSNDSGYNFPFWPVEKGTLVYRFDCGSFGWQFNLMLDASGRVSEVERKWIH